MVNRKTYDILLALSEKKFHNQRSIAEYTGYSLGTVNQSVKSLLDARMIDGHFCLTEKAEALLEENKPCNAVILAAGFGMRMVPINTETPKALLEVNGEPLIERIIHQLHQVGIKKISVVVGFMKEYFEYLIDEFGVDLVVNSEYASKNNLHSLNLVREQLGNTYIIPCDVWTRNNIFKRNELYSWYLVSDQMDEDSDVRINRKKELVRIDEKDEGNAMIGIAYICSHDSTQIKQRLEKYDKKKSYQHCFWEETLYEKDRMWIQARIIPKDSAVEINTFEQLRELDQNSNQLKSDAMEIIQEALKCTINDICNISILKKGMTNRSFLFDCNGNRYIMRIPGEGTDHLIDREQEANVYHVISEHGICDEIIYINPKNGYKITKYIENTRVCNPENMDDLKLCMKKLKGFHEQKLKVQHTFDIFKQIDFYESLWGQQGSAYRDYRKTKDHIWELQDYIRDWAKESVLTHIDAVPDNFLFDKNERIYLIDWEYAGMQDPHVDIAMFCIYALYSREQIDRLIDIYFENKCEKEIRVKIYCYIAVCGLLWSNWCEYKRNLGVDFGEYSLRQYRYAKEYYTIAKEEIEKLGACEHE